MSTMYVCTMLESVSIIESTLFNIFGLKIVPIQTLGLKLNFSLKQKKKNFHSGNCSEHEAY